MANLGNTIINGILRVTGPIRGNADSASKLQTPRKINGVNFDGTQDITIEAGSSGHTIINSSGTAMTQRSKLKFMNSTISDDATNDMTIITPAGVIGNYLPLSGGTMTGNISFSHVNASVDGHLEWNSGTVKERITICDRTATTDPVFIFEQSRDSGSSYPALLTINGDGEIIAKTFTGALSGNASTATKLQTARTINGTSFNGSANITTANWGTARNIGIVNSDGTGTAVTTSVNGSANVNLKLPATIKATLTGNASTATTLANARTINGTSFNGSANITTANWGTARNIGIVNSDGTGTAVVTSVNGSANVNLKLPSDVKAMTLSQQNIRDIKPNEISTVGISGYFATKEGMTGSAGTDWQDLIVLNGWNDTSSGNLNAISFDKSTKAIYHYQAAKGATTWGTPNQIAYTNSTVAAATKANQLTTARTIAISGGVTGTATSFNGTANITIPVTAVDASKLTNKNTIKASEINNNKHWIPSNDNSVTNFVSMTVDEYEESADSLPTGTVVAITDSNESYVTTQPSSITCDLPLDL